MRQPQTGSRKRVDFHFLPSIIPWRSRWSCFPRSLKLITETRGVLQTSPRDFSMARSQRRKSDDEDESARE